MNEAQNQSRRRKEKIKWIVENYLNDHSIQKSFTRQFQENNEDKSKTDAAIICAISVQTDISNKHFDLRHFYEVFNLNKSTFTPAEQISIIQLAEECIRYAIQIEELQSKERMYEAETAYIEHQGFALNETYRITFLNNRHRQVEEWLVTEFRVYSKGSIHPVNGSKFKKDGTPYLKAQPIYVGCNGDFTIERKL